MERIVILTKDDSHTIEIPGQELTYHSRHGAIQESNHVFLQAGFEPLLRKNLPRIRILEMGFGTGLNALLTFEATTINRQASSYTAVELYPLKESEYSQLNYCSQLGKPELQSVFLQMHQDEWEKSILFNEFFSLKKIRGDMTNIILDENYHLVYFDAFAPNAQPELWSEDVFRKIFSLTEAGGVLVTYCSKGTVRRAMEAAGFAVEKIPGPPGKREMVRAIKPGK